MREKLLDLLEGDVTASGASNIIHSAISTLIVLNVLAVVLESFDSLKASWNTYFTLFEYLSVAIFSVEYLLRLSVSDLHYPHLSRPLAFVRYIVSPIALIDLAAILPFYLPLLITLDLRALRIFRLTRLMRMLKIGRYTSALSTMRKVIVKRREELAITFFLTGLTVIFAATLMYYIESPHQPEAFNNILSAIWWAVATLTTVGYGDIFPVTAMGRVLAGVIALSGIGLVALPTGILGSSFLDELHAHRTRGEDRGAHFHKRVPKVATWKGGRKKGPRR